MTNGAKAMLAVGCIAIASIFGLKLRADWNQSAKATEWKEKSEQCAIDTEAKKALDASGKDVNSLKGDELRTYARAIYCEQLRKEAEH